MFSSCDVSVLAPTTNGEVGGASKEVIHYGVQGTEEKASSSRVITSAAISLPVQDCVRLFLGHAEGIAVLDGRKRMEWRKHAV